MVYLIASNEFRPRKQQSEGDKQGFTKIKLNAREHFQEEKKQTIT